MFNQKQRHVLVIGGAGYIGSVLSGYLLASGYRVRSFDSLVYNHGQSVLPWLSDENYEFLLGDLTRQKELNAALTGVTDVVVLAGLVGDPITKKYPTQSMSINSIGIRKLMDSLQNYNLDKVIFVSTCSNYGFIPEDAVANEEWILNPLSLYAKSKVEIEEHIISLKQKVNYCPTILRFSTAFGLSPRMRFDLTVNEFVRELYLGNELVVYDHQTWRPYCHVLDFSEAVKLVLEAHRNAVNFEIFNAGGEKNNYTKEMIVEEVRKCFPSSKVKYQQHGSDPRNYRVDFSKIKHVLNFEPKYSVVDGIKEVQRALENRLFESAHTAYGNYEIHEANC